MRGLRGLFGHEGVSTHGARVSGRPPTAAGRNAALDGTPGSTLPFSPAEASSAPHTHPALPFDAPPGPDARRWLIDLQTGDPLGDDPGGQEGDEWRDVANRVSGTNLVEPVVDGATYIERWLREAVVLIDEPDGAALFHFAWKLHDVGAKGRYSPKDTTVFAVLKRLQEAGIEPTVLLSGHAVGILNGPALAALRRRGVKGAIVDELFSQKSASQHAKLTIFRRGPRVTCLIGSADLARGRWDSTAHDGLDPARYAAVKPPSHDLGLAVDGPAGADLEALAGRFLAMIRQEAVSHNRRRRAIPHVNLCPPGPPALPPVLGRTVVQVLATVPSPPDFDFQPEYSLYRAYANAIRQATGFIYIEDQYFWPAFAYASSTFHETGEEDLLPLLIEKLRDGVDIIAVLPPPVRAPVLRMQADARHFAIAALRRAQGAGRGARGLSGTFTAAMARVGRRYTKIHSKLLLCDDEYFVLGSQNVNRRSMFGDLELGVGVADSRQARQLRVRLWSEHLDVPEEDLANWRTAVGLLQRRVGGLTGRLVPYPDVAQPGAPGMLDRLLWDRLHDSLAR